MLGFLAAEGGAAAWFRAALGRVLLGFLIIDFHICGQYDTVGGANVPKPETFVKSESPEVPSLETFVNLRREC